MAIITIGIVRVTASADLQADFRANSKDDIGHARRELPIQGFVLVCGRSLQKMKGEIPSFLITEFTHAPFESYPLR